MFEITDWLSGQGIDYEWVNENNVSIPCISCGKKKRHFTVSVSHDRPFYNCYKCGVRGHWVGLVSALSQIPIAEAESIVKKTLFTTKKQEEKEEKPKPLIFPTPYRWSDEASFFLRARGDFKRFVDAHGFYFTNQWPYSDRIVMPVYWDRVPVSFQARTILDDVYPKYMSAPGHPIKDHLYGKFDPSKPVILVEGIFDQIRMKSFGYNVAAVFGKTVSDKQIGLLRSLGVHGVRIMFDADATMDLEKAWYRLSYVFSVTCIPVWNKDPGEMSPPLIEEAIGKETDSVLDILVGKVERMAI